MNEDILKGKLKELGGSIRERWGKLTDNDIQEAGGKKDKLVGALQKAYGYSREEAEREYDRFMDVYEKRNMGKERAA
ncbi:MAG TPA: CsbD family protein [Syntrophorhabdaceae bacterium]|nr:CsbD family protein [Syntrophorhabdaceae bacterium]